MSIDSIWSTRVWLVNLHYNINDIGRYNRLKALSHYREMQQLTKSACQLVHLQ